MSKEERPEIVYFGPGWDEPLKVQPALRIDVPVGQRCGLCRERLTADDRGVMLRCPFPAARDKPVHHHCLNETAE